MIVAELIGGPLDGDQVKVVLEEGEALPGTIRISRAERFLYYGLTRQSPIEYTFEGEVEKEVLKYAED